MDKKIDFHDIGFSWDLVTHAKSVDQISSECYSSLKNDIELFKQYSIAATENKEIVMEILDDSDLCFFGVMSKIENLKDGVLREIIVEDKTMKISVNNYTYFLMDFKAQRIATIYNAKVPKITTNFLSYIRGMLTKTYYIIEITPLLDLEHNKLNRVSEIKRILMKFSGGTSAANKLLSFEEYLHLSNDSIVGATLTLDVKLENISEKTRESFANTQYIEENFHKFQVHAISDDDEFNEFDLIEGLLRRRITIDIDEDFLKSKADFMKIKEALKASIYESF